MTDMENDDIFGEVIHSYTRKQAIDDGVLVDLTEVGKVLGIRHPIAITAGAKGEIMVGILDENQEKQIHDMLVRFRIAAQQCDGSILHFSLRNGYGVEVELKALCTPGDTPEPVITVMLPHED